MPNAFESGERKLIPAVLVYLRCGDELLMIHRDSGRPDDYHAGKWNGLGGKLEPDESPLEAARRVLREEAGVALPESAFRSLGVVQFPNFKAHKNEDWIAFIFEACSEVKPELIPGAEGSLHWISEGSVLDLDLWPGDRYFLPLVLQRKPFFGTIWYRGAEVFRHSVTAL